MKLEYYKELHATDDDFASVYGTCEKASFGKFYKLDWYLFIKNRFYVPTSFICKLLVCDGHGGLLGNHGVRKTFVLLHERLWKYHLPFNDVLHEHLWKYQLPFIDVLHERLWDYHLPFIEFAYIWSSHSGVKKILDILYEHLCWSKMKRDVNCICGRCITCRKAKFILLPHGLHTPLPIPSESCVDISMDFVLGLPRKERSRNSIFVVMDGFIEFAYNRTMHTTTLYSPFEIVYRLNLFTPLDLISLSVDNRSSLDGCSQILEQINDNAYEINDNVTNIFPFDPGGDSRSNPFEERGNDGNQGGPSLKDMLQVPDEPNTSSRA